MEDTFIAAHQAWEAIGLSTLQKKLDAQGLEIINNQNSSLSSRKRLAEQTKDFKKYSDEEKLREFKMLLKAYQTEIDSMTKRTRFAETNFLDVYKIIAEAPDPSPILASAIDQSKQVAELSALSIENEKLREEVSNVTTELATARANEIAVGPLKQRLTKYEVMLEEMVEEKVASKEQELKSAFDEKVRLYKETEYSLKRQLNQTKDELGQLQSSNNATQSKLVDSSQKYDQEVAAKLGQIEIILVDLERANVKCATLERENAQLNKQAHLRERGDHSPEEWLDPIVLSKKNKALESEMARLLTDLDVLSGTIQEKDRKLKSIAFEAERDVASKRMEIAQLSSQIAHMEDYADIKRELSILKSVEFEGWYTDVASSKAGSEKPSLEVLLLEKNRKLSTEVVELKDRMNQIQSELQTSRATVQDKEKTLQTNVALIAKLEEDMMHLNNAIAAQQAKAVVQSPNSLESLISVPAPAGAFNNAVSNNDPSLMPSRQNDLTIIPILTAQRDRYRQRNSELEGQLRQLNVQVSNLKGDVAKLNQDNIQLYEKLRYTQSFDNRTNRRSSGPQIEVDMGSSSPSAAYRRDPLSDKYHNLYEGTLDPFKRFSRQEENRRLAAMNPADRAAFILTTYIVHNKYSRWIFLTYSACLHILVFATLVLMSTHHESCSASSPNVLRGGLSGSAAGAGSKGGFAFVNRSSRNAV